MSTIVALKSNDSFFSLYEALHCDWDGHCFDLSDDDKIEGEGEEEFLKSIELQVNEDFSKISKAVGWNLVKYGPIHIIDFKKVKEDNYRKLEERKERLRSQKNEEMKLMIRSTEGISQPNFCLNSITGRIPKLRLCESVRRICPPREWTSRGLKMRQYVSCQIPSRREVIALKDKVDEEIEKRKETMTEDGMCSERRQLVTSLFDELIRQVTVNCLERGQLLLEVRDEMHRTFNSYKILFNSLIAHQINKIMTCKTNIDDLQENIEKVKHEIQELKDISEDFQPAYTKIQNKFEKEQNEDLIVYEKEHERLVNINESFKNLLLTVVQKSPEQDSVLM